MSKNQPVAVASDLGLDVVNQAVPQPGSTVPLRPAPRQEPRFGEATADRVGIPLSLLTAVFKRTWPLVLISALALGMGAYGMLGAMPQKYTSEAKALVGTLQGSTDSLRASASLSTTYADSLNSVTTLRGVANTVGLATLPSDELNQLATVTANEKSRILTVKATWEDPETARNMVAGLMERLEELQNEIKPPLPPPGLTPGEAAEIQQRQSVGQVHVVQRPTFPAVSDDNLRPILSIIVGGLGALGSYGALVVMAHRGREPIHRTLEAVGADRSMGAVRIKGRKPGFGAALRATAGADGYVYQRIARHALYKLSHNTGRIVVCGALSSQAVGAHFAARTAAAIARQGQEVKLIDLTDWWLAGMSMGLKTGDQDKRAVDPGMVFATSNDTAALQDMQAACRPGSRDESVYVIAVGTYLGGFATLPADLLGAACFVAVDVPSSSAGREVDDTATMVRSQRAELLGAVAVDSSAISGRIFNTTKELPN